MSRKPNLEARTRILETAFQLIHGHGFKGVSMEGVAAAAGIKKANLFHYYPTKEALGLAVFDFVTNGLKEQVTAQFAEDGKNPIKTVEAMFEETIACMKRNHCARGCFIGNLAQELSDDHEKLREKICEYFQFWAQQLADFLKRWQRARYFAPSLKPREAAEGLLALYEGATLFCKARKQVSALEHAKRMAMKYLEGFRP
ncbi:MAG: TetR/AcrR family transcriptional regulator [Elusimicrobia bacterium]|nr:TetR/AcrR family transcriptional regulator [Elusimicrobiota bacterium]